jgi:hypothetical protein
MTSRQALKCAATILLTSCSIATMVTPAIADQRSDIRKAYMESSFANSGDGVMDTISKVFREVDPEAKRITNENINFIEKLAVAQSRARISSYWLSMDLDGDSKVSRDEAAAMPMRRSKGIVRENEKRQFLDLLEQQLDKQFKADTNKSGFIEAAELFNAPEEFRSDLPRSLGLTNFARALLKADPNNDGVLTQTEGMSIAMKLLDEIDDEISKTKQ